MSSIILVDSINFKDTFASGQTFAFAPDAGGYLGAVAGKPVRVCCSTDCECGSMDYANNGRGRISAACRRHGL